MLIKLFKNVFVKALMSWKILLWKIDELKYPSLFIRFQSMILKTFSIINVVLARVT